MGTRECWAILAVRYNVFVTVTGVPETAKQNSTSDLHATASKFNLRPCQQNLLRLAAFSTRIRPRISFLLAFFLVHTEQFLSDAVEVCNEEWLSKIWTATEGIFQSLGINNDPNSGEASDGTAFTPFTNFCDQQSRLRSRNWIMNARGKSHITCNSKPIVTPFFCTNWSILVCKDDGR